jgi:hypothetical protein
MRGTVCYSINVLKLQPTEREFKTHLYNSLCMYDPTSWNRHGIGERFVAQYALLAVFQCVDAQKMIPGKVYVSGHSMCLLWYVCARCWAVTPERFQIKKTSDTWAYGSSERPLPVTGRKYMVVKCRKP